MSWKSRPILCLFGALHGAFARTMQGMKNPFLPCLRVLAGGLSLLIVLTGGTGAARAAEPAPADDFQSQVQQLALDGTRTLDASGHGWRVEVEVGALDARLRLAPCDRVEPYLASGTRLWGKSRIGLRCMQGPKRWNVFMPVTVRVFGRALVAAGPLPAGSVLTAGDVRVAEVDLAEDAATALGDATLAVGRTLQRAVAAGQSLRQNHLKPRQWFASGDMVRVLAIGEGFSVASDGQALTNGIEGEPARVRTEAGRVLTGMPVGERRMDMAL